MTPFFVLTKIVIMYSWKENNVSFFLVISVIIYRTILSYPALFSLDLSCTNDDNKPGTEYHLFIGLLSTSSFYSPALNFINVPCTAFTLSDPKSVKRY